jgi:hypothetical protein
LQSSSKNTRRSCSSSNCSVKFKYCYTYLTFVMSALTLSMNMFMDRSHSSDAVTLRVSLRRWSRLYMRSRVNPQLLRGCCGPFNTDNRWDRVDIPPGMRSAHDFPTIREWYTRENDSGRGWEIEDPLRRIWSDETTEAED